MGEAVVKITREQTLRRITNADEYESELAGVDSWMSSLRLVAKHNRTARQRGRDLIEAHFWLGGAIAKAESLSQWGDRFFQKLDDQAGVSPFVARRAMRLWDLFDGDVTALYVWCSTFIEDHGKVLLGDVTKLVESNREIVDERQYLRGLEGRLVRDEIPEPVVKAAGLRDALTRRKRAVSKMAIQIPEPEEEEEYTPNFLKRLTLKDARRKLVFEPDLEIPIEEVQLADGITYDLVVSLKAKR